MPHSTAVRPVSGRRDFGRFIDYAYTRNACDPHWIPPLRLSDRQRGDGFDSDPTLLMPHNPPEYGEYVESAGYHKVKDLFAWLYDLDRDAPPIIERLAQRVRERDRILVRPLDLAEFARETDRIRDIYCGAWMHNWGFVPPTAAEFRRIATEMKPIFDPRGAVCAEIDGRAVACAIALPDVNQALKGTDGRLAPQTLFRLLFRRRYIDQLRLLLLGVLPEFRAHGLYPLLVFELHRQVRSGPYRRMEFSWVLEDNRDINQPAEEAGAHRYSGTASTRRRSRHDAPRGRDRRIRVHRSSSQHATRCAWVRG